MNQQEQKYPNTVHVAGYVSWVSEPRKFESGAQTRTIFIAWGKGDRRTSVPVKVWADLVEQTGALKKADHVEVKGRLTSWEQKDTGSGKNKSHLEVTAESVTLLRSAASVDDLPF